VYSHSLNQASQYIATACYLTVPITTVLSYRAWLRNRRIHLSNWRRRVGITSILAISASWLFGIVLAWLLITDNADFLSEKWKNGLILFSLTGATLASCQKGSSRIYGIAAGLLMAASWKLGLVILNVR
jgi:hypothetical protein